MPKRTQRFDVETNIAPPMRKAITLVYKGLVVYVAQGAFGYPLPGDDQSQEALDRLAHRIAVILEE